MQKCKTLEIVYVLHGSTPVIEALAAANDEASAETPYMPPYPTARGVG